MPLFRRSFQAWLSIPYDYLKRFHHQSLAVSSAHRILIQHCLNRLPHNQKTADTHRVASGARSRWRGIDCRWT